MFSSSSVLSRMNLEVSSRLLDSQVVLDFTHFHNFFRQWIAKS